MKVTTDGCLFGAIVAKELSDKGSCWVLDIGAGTGLLSLMIAQENEAATIDAVEIDTAAAGQAQENVLASPWKEQIEVFQVDVLQYRPAFQYDFIISNPPFYESQLISPSAGRQLAHHNSGLTLQQLFAQVKTLLKRNFLVILPFYRMEEAIRIANEYGLFLEKQWLIRQTSTHGIFRSVMMFGYERTSELNKQEIIIKNESGDYTMVFKKLLFEFYVRLKKND